MLRLLFKKLTRLTEAANQRGINLPMIKDPKTGIGSVSLTLVFISSILVVLGLVGKWSGRLGTVDINNALEFFYASCVLYFGRNTWRRYKPGKKPKETKPEETQESPPTEEDSDGRRQD